MLIIIYKQEGRLIDFRLTVRCREAGLSSKIKMNDFGRQKGGSA